LAEVRLMATPRPVPLYFRAKDPVTSAAA
jgi:hypothetical protein